jgi:hypothetical protein
MPIHLLFIYNYIRIGKIVEHKDCIIDVVFNVMNLFRMVIQNHLNRNIDLVISENDAENYAKLCNRNIPNGINRTC